ncbi:MAG: DUF4115 domain-containing protein [Candidatus Omnitrophota bacterium]|nr:DUF4115 domain-containing protein [Candidatus Omnitrophota bacterium]
METVGAKLKKIRLEKGLTLEEVQKKTKIQLNILQAIEGDSITNISPVYLKGFLKIYCQVLGLDPKDFTPDAKSRAQAPSAAAKAEAPAQAAPEKEAKPRVSAVLDDSGIKLAPSGRPRNFKKIALIIAVLLIVFGLFKLGKFISSRGGARPKTASVVSSVAKGKPARQAQRPKPRPSTAPKNKLSENINLTVRARQNCMVVLKADGKLVFQRVLERGRYENWQAKEKFELFLGNAGGVDLEVNGQPFPSLGRKREAKKNIVITKEGLTVK